jgi:hypothetical protein
VIEMATLAQKPLYFISAEPKIKDMQKYKTLLLQIRTIIGHKYRVYGEDLDDDVVKKYQNKYYADMEQELKVMNYDEYEKACSDLDILVHEQYLLYADDDNVANTIRPIPNCDECHDVFRCFDCWWDNIRVECRKCHGIREPNTSWCEDCINDMNS